MQTESSPRISLRTRRRGLLAAAIAAAMAIVPAGAEAAARAEVVTPKPVTAEVVQPQLATPAQAPSSAPAPAPAPAAAAPESSEPAPSAAASPARSGPKHRWVQGSDDSSSADSSSPSSGGSSPVDDQTTVNLYAGWWGRLYADALGQVGSQQWLNWLDSLPRDQENQLNQVIANSFDSVQGHENQSVEDTEQGWVPHLDGPSTSPEPVSAPPAASSEVVDPPSEGWFDWLAGALAAGVPGSTGGGVFVDGIPVAHKAD